MPSSWSNIVRPRVIVAYLWRCLVDAVALVAPWSFVAYVFEEASPPTWSRDRDYWMETRGQLLYGGAHAAAPLASLSSAYDDGPTTPMRRLPLAGASICVLAHKGDEAEATLAATIRSLGGATSPGPDGATHAVAEYGARGPTAEQRDVLACCRLVQVPVVAPSFLRRVASLDDGSDWTRVDPADHEPPFMRTIDRPRSSNGQQYPPVAQPSPYAPTWSHTLFGGTTSSGTKDTAARRGDGATAVPPACRPPPPPPPRHHHRSRQHGNPPGTTHRRDAASSLRASIAETWTYLAREHPDVVEADELRRATELSMLDCALALRPTQEKTSTSSSSSWDTGWLWGKPKGESPSPESVLGVDASAPLETVKKAYRRRARETHPDKGGAPAAFQRVLRAYRTILANRGRLGHDDASNDDDDDQASSGRWLADAKTTTQLDDELRDHRGLVDALFRNHGADLEANANKQQIALKALGLRIVEAGASNVNERGETIANSCFYLSLAASYLHGLVEEESFGVGKDDDDFTDDRKDVALKLKRLIEAAVLAAHPEWASQGKCGEDVQAFSDFLVYSLDSPTLIADWAVAVFDTTSGFVDVYKGKLYDACEDQDHKRANLLCVRYQPGHYQALLPETRATRRPTLDDLLAALDRHAVLYVVTDG